MIGGLPLFVVPQQRVWKQTILLPLDHVSVVVITVPDATNHFSHGNTMRLTHSFVPLPAGSVQTTKWIGSS
jgi:hypothetical protein